MKRFKKLLLIFVFVVFTVILSACEEGAEKLKDIAQDAADAVKGFRLGEWENNIYTNEKFDLTVSLPEEWYIYNSQELAGIFGEAADIMKDSETEIDEGILFPLFYVTDNKDINLITANVNLTAARALLAPDLDAEYTDEALAQLAAPMEQYYEVEIKKAGETELGGIKAFLLTIDTSITGTEMMQYQKVYQVYKSGYLLTFTIASFDEAVMDSIESWISFE